MIQHVVYYSSATNNTHRFVEKLGLPATRIPIRGDVMPEVCEPYVLIIPTYGGGASMMGRPSRPVLPQIYAFLEHGGNKEFLRAVIAAGNLNFGEDYCAAGTVIRDEYHVPYVYRFELMGTKEDVDAVREGLRRFRV